MRRPSSRRSRPSGTLTVGMAIRSRTAFAFFRLPSDRRDARSAPSGDGHRRHAAAGKRRPAVGGVSARPVAAERGPPGAPGTRHTCGELGQRWQRQRFGRSQRHGRQLAPGGLRWRSRSFRRSCCRPGFERRNDHLPRHRGSGLVSQPARSGEQHVRRLQGRPLAAWRRTTSPAIS